MNPLVLAFVTLVGLVVGSFLNVVILRLHAGRDFVKGRSQCPHCKHQLAWYENIPLLSYIVLGGRCKHCKKPISPQYPLVELATAALFALAYVRSDLATYGDLLIFVMWLYVLSSFIVLAVYDLRWYLLPDKVLLPIMIPAGAILISEATITGSVHVLWGPLLAAVVFGGAFYTIAAISNGRWMGGGDIKLAFVMGLLLGLQKTALAMFLAFDSAALVGLVLIALSRKKRSDMIPFGPFLILGTIAAYYFGTDIINWYKDISGLNLL
jgi:leader peptidase (prepilin peptidase)/N-methyltransferase